MIRHNGKLVGDTSYVSGISRQVIDPVFHMIPGCRMYQSFDFRSAELASLTQMVVLLGLCTVHCTHLRKRPNQTQAFTKYQLGTETSTVKSIRIDFGRIW